MTPRISTVVVSAAALTLAACNAGADDAASTSTRPAPPAPATTPAAPMLVQGCTPPPPVRERESIPTFPSAPDPATVKGKTYEATLQTNCGNIVLELDGAKAPQTVASFKQLAEGKYWEPSPCHRLVTEGIHVLQCGDPTGTGTGDPGYGYGIENAPADGTYPEGSLAMARNDNPNSNGGQFFINYKTSHISPAYGGYTIFGKVTSGMDLLHAIAGAGSVPARGFTAPAQPVSVLKVTVTEKKA